MVYVELVRSYVYVFWVQQSEVSKGFWFRKVVLGGGWDFNQVELGFYRGEIVGWQEWEFTEGFEQFCGEGRIGGRVIFGVWFGEGVVDELQLWVLTQDLGGRYKWVLVSGELWGRGGDENGKKVVMLVGVSLEVGMGEVG